MNLLVNYYDAGPRQKEIDYCLQQNLANELITKVIVFNQFKEIDHPKVENLMVKIRPTYQDFFDHFEDGINIIANADIFFDTTLSNARHLIGKKCYALTRWEFDGETSKRFEAVHKDCPAHFSQDVWMFRGKTALKGFDKVIAQRANARAYDWVRFTIGVAGCDNVLAAMLKKHYSVKNPASHIKCHHYHLNQKPQPYTHRMTGARSTWGIIKQGIVPISGL